MSERRTYEGSCHCGAVRFRLTCEPITAGLRCNCSMCRRRGAVMSSRYFRSDELVVTGLAALACYRFGDLTMNHHFCRSCGIHPFSEVVTDDYPPLRTGDRRVNLGCIDELDAPALELTLVDGRSF